MKRIFCSEAILALSCTSLILWLLKESLFLGHYTFSHDNFYWNYPVFHYFAESLMNGHYPFWNPYSHGGEPFYPLLGQMRLLEPITLIVICLGKLFTQNIGILFAWNRITLIFFSLLGIYCVYRPFSTPKTRLILIPILTFSSFFLGSLAADGVISHFLWIPFQTYFLLEIFYWNRPSWKNYAGFALALGVNFQSYFIATSLIFCFVFLTALYTRNRVSLFLNRKMIAAMLLASAFSVPSILLYLQKDRYVFPLRLVPNDYKTLPAMQATRAIEGSTHDLDPGFLLPIEAIRYSGSTSRIWDYLQILTPDGNYHLRGNDSPNIPWGNPSEVYLYLGIIPWFLILFGLLKAKGDLKKAFGITAGVFFLLALGPSLPGHQLLYSLFLPLRLLRHTEFLAPIGLFALLYFLVLGSNKVLEEGFNKILLPLGFFFTHAVLVLVFNPNRISFILYLLIALSVILFSRKRVSFSILFTVVVFDLISHFYQARVLYNHYYHPSWILNASPTPLAETPLLGRESYPTFVKVSGSQAQSMRYLPLLYRKGFAFSEVRTLGEGTDDFSAARTGKRWDSLFLLKDYSELIHSSVSNEKLKDLFSIGKPLFRFEDEGKWQYSSYSHEHFQLAIELQTEEVLFWSDGYDPDWQASMNGKQLKIDKAEGNFKSIRLPAGKYTLSLDYNPRLHQFGLILFYVAFLAGLSSFVHGSVSTVRSANKNFRPILNVT